MYIMCRSAGGRGGWVMDRAFLIIYNLKKNLSNNPPPPLKIQSIYFLFPHVSVLLSLLEVILGHVSVADSQERWWGGGVDHSIFAYTVDSYRCDSVLLAWQPLV